MSYLIISRYIILEQGGADPTQRAGPRLTEGAC